MRRWLIIGGLLGLLAGAAAGGAYFAGLFEAPPERAAGAVEPIEAAPPDLSKIAYFRLTSLMVPAVRGGRFRNYLSFDLQIEVADEATAIGLREREPFLRDALLRSFSKDPVETRDGPADFDSTALRQRLTEVIQGVVGADIATGVLIIRVLPIKG